MVGNGHPILQDTLNRAFNVQHNADGTHFPAWYPYAIPENFGTIDGAADNVQIQAAIDSLPPGGGKVVLSGGTYNLSEPLVLKYGVSIYGQTGRASKLVTVGNIPAITWDQGISSYDRNITIQDVWLVGSGQVVGGSNNTAILINHPWGIDNLSLRNLFIEQFGGYAIKTYQPGSGDTHNCFQFSHWDSIQINNCASGILMGYGFCGESLFTNISVLYPLDNNYCLEFTTSPVGVGPQGLAFVGCTFGQGFNGVSFRSASRGVISFTDCHFEAFQTAAVTMSYNDNDKVIFSRCWFILNWGSSATGILTTALGDIVLDSCSWKASVASAEATQKYIWVNGTTLNGINIIGSHRVTGNVLTTEIVCSVTINSINGRFTRLSSTTGKISSQVLQSNNLQTRGLSGELAMNHAANLTGSIAISSATSSVSITFLRTEPDTSYQIIAIVDFGLGIPGWTPAVSIGNKTVNGFTAYFSAASPAGGYSLNWILVRG
jgi:hypothetical protein